MLEGTRLGRSLIIRMTQRSIAAKSRQYPALNSAIRAIGMAYDRGLQGYTVERTEFVQLLATPTCRNLLDLFFSRERARSLKTWSPAAGYVAHDLPTQRVGVIGAGAMGAGIGQLASHRGFEVVMKEIDAPAAEAGRQRIAQSVAAVAKRKGWDAAKRQEMTDRIEISCQEESLADCDLVVEAVVEREDVKADVFAMMDRVVKKSAMLTSNTSSLSVTKMAQATGRPGQVAGLHFFNPVHRMELVEVVRAKDTDDETIARLVAFVRALGKTPVVTADSPGFLVNRVLFPYLGEAVLMVGQSYDVLAMDKEVRRFGMPMGPLELLDQVGLDVALHVASSLDTILAGVAPVVDQLSVMVQHGHLGKKSGLGFYHYKHGKRQQPAELPNAMAAAPRHRDESGQGNDGMTPVQRRLVYPMLSEAIRCYQEQVVDQPWAIDLAMVLGTGFAPHRGGPLHLVDAIGPSLVMENLNRLQADWGDRFAPPQRLVEMVQSGQKFFASGKSISRPQPASS
jgi:3-hydroxyacyl-CoA dehydrogenase/enoyl-CoA hydratase/3-hydroxybutyryl-CoA epimerase